MEHLAGSQAFQEHARKNFHIWRLRKHTRCFCIATKKFLRGVYQKKPIIADCSVSDIPTFVYEVHCGSFLSQAFCHDLCAFTMVGKLLHNRPVCDDRPLLVHPTYVCVKPTRKLRSKSPRFSTPVRGSVALTLLALQSSPDCAGSAEFAHRERGGGGRTLLACTVRRHTCRTPWTSQQSYPVTARFCTDRHTGTHCTQPSALATAGLKIRLVHLFAEVKQIMISVKAKTETSGSAYEPELSAVDSC